MIITEFADSKNLDGELEIVGEVENQETSASTYTEIVGTFYDVNGKVVYVRKKERKEFSVVRECRIQSVTTAMHSISTSRPSRAISLQTISV